MRLDARTLEGAPVDLSDWAVGSRASPRSCRCKAQSSGRRRLSCSYSTAEDEDGRTLVVVARDVTPAQEFEALRAEFGRLVEQEAARRLVVEQLQAAVVPDTPVVPGLELAVAYVASDPKEPTGGDLWDWHVMADGQLHIAVVDVLGHGVAATKSALSVVHTLRAVALDGTPLEDMVGRASALLERQDAELVATVVLARLDPATGRLRIASGGHPPALIVSSTGERSHGRRDRWRDRLAGCRQRRRGGALPRSRRRAAALHRRAGGGAQGHRRRARQPGPRDRLGLPPAGCGAGRRAGGAGPGRRRATGRHPRAGRPAYQPCRCCDGARPWPPGGGSSDRTGRQPSTPDARRCAGSATTACRPVMRHWSSPSCWPTRSGPRAEPSSSRCRIDDGRVSIAVSDDGPGLEELPVDTLPPLDAEGSRGLFLVRKLSTGLQLDVDADRHYGAVLAARRRPAVPGQTRRDAAS